MKTSAAVDGSSSSSSGCRWAATEGALKLLYNVICTLSLLNKYTITKKMQEKKNLANYAS